MRALFLLFVLAGLVLGPLGLTRLGPRCEASVCHLACCESHGAPGTGCCCGRHRAPDDSQRDGSGPGAPRDCCASAPIAPLDATPDRGADSQRDVVPATALLAVVHDVVLPWSDVAGRRAVCGREPAPPPDRGALRSVVLRC